MYNLTSISKTGNVKWQTLTEYLPAPYYDLTCCCQYRQLGTFAFANQTKIKCSQGIVASYTSESAHIQKMHYIPVSLTRYSTSFMDALATFMRFGSKTIVGCYLFRCAFTICQNTEPVNRYKKVWTGLVSHSKRCLESLVLLFEIPVFAKITWYAGFTLNSLHYPRESDLSTNGFINPGALNNGLFIIIHLAISFYQPLRSDI